MIRRAGALAGHDLKTKPRISKNSQAEKGPAGPFWGEFFTGMGASGIDLT